jgi:hypothetical protein
VTVVLPESDDDNQAVLSWVARQLAPWPGSEADLSPALFGRLAEMPSGFAVVPDWVQLSRPWEINDHIPSWPRPRHLVGQNTDPVPDFFRRAAAIGLRTIVSEEYLHQPGNPHLPPAIAWSKSKAVVWGSLADTEEAESALHAGSGYPDIAFLTGSLSTDLGLTNGVHLAASDCAALAAAAQVILTSAFDGEGGAIVGVSTEEMARSLASRT